MVKMFNVLLFVTKPGIKSEIYSALDVKQFTVTETDSLNKTTQIVESDPSIDIVIIGGCSAHGDGVQLLRFLKSDQRLCLIPVLVTGHSFDDVSIKIFTELKVDGIAVLPLNMEAFSARTSKLAEERRTTVLVVDDEPMIRELLEQFLELERFRAITAESVDEALEQLKRTRIDAIISDIMMPKKTGHDLLVEVKVQYPQIPFIFITGYANKMSPKQLLSEGADAYITKPFHNTEMIFTLRHILETKGRSRHISKLSMQASASK